MAAALALALVASSGCHDKAGGGDNHRAAANPGAEPRVAVEVRGTSLIAGRPMPYRLHLVNDTKDVIIPISVAAADGTGGASWARALVGDVVYDAGNDRFLENPVAQHESRSFLFRSALQPGEELIEDFEVRYDHSGPVKETFHLLYHRLSPSEFDQRVYVGTGEGMPRRFQPVGLFTDPLAREGALLAGFYLREKDPPSTVDGTITVEIPPIPPAIAKKIQDAGFDPARTMLATWASGWIAGDAERSVLVGQSGGAAKVLAGVPWSAMREIDESEDQVSFCVTGASREEVAPFFAGYEIVPFKCLHVSVPRTRILPVLEKISAAGYSVEPVEFELRQALDVTKRKSG